MIREIRKDEIDQVYNLVSFDKARNYFILLTLDGNIDLYDKIYGQWENDKLIAILLRRKSGTLQFYAKGSFDIQGFTKLISTLDYKTMIGPKSILDAFNNKSIFTHTVEGAFISKRENFDSDCYDISPGVQSIRINDLENVVNLYKKVFHSFPSKDIMEDKILSNRGRGVCIKKGKRIISAAQTDYETKKGALIVGVATDPDFKNQGLATKCVKALIKDLNRELYLQYDNLDAGRIYDKLGFKSIDRVRHYIR
ncbi:GNAT family N-acetyltransferase [Tissierella sp. Yu-01]|uniref:GNAT family N-acetyltransferase n=1 Tax=Tissierella sp. Yu-01 TaxID=3035694 RepID=UPI00240D100C|nr:GNAT family N-acetyltransferase [Tissierella sp. Yu-01]WFA08200.1 GNAT family N-acetyltransferase [Tissierella sp. Yu-01]